MPQLLLRQLSPSRIALSATTLTLAALFGSMAVLPALGAKPKMEKASAHVMVVKPANITTCTGCHGKDLTGSKGFSPSIRASGELKHYTKAQFERLMKTGVTNDGGMVRKPMRVFHYTNKEADLLYTYLKSLK